MLHICKYINQIMYIKNFTWILGVNLSKYVTAELNHSNQKQ